MVNEERISFGKGTMIYSIRTSNCEFRHSPNVDCCGLQNILRVSKIFVSRNRNWKKRH